ncbi:MAG: glycosyltransferase family 2 protein [Rhodovarius sp.]|nr:glycosyltransferase family 2 protein [Rhodovarius sp.]
MRRRWQSFLPGWRPEVHLYSIVWNEAAMLEFFFRHYDPWVSRYVFFDNGSTDATREIIARHPRAECRPFPWKVADSFVLSAQILHNECWKESRGKADWVVLTAVDEHLHHPDLPGYLRRCTRAGITAIPAVGYQMVAEDFPPSGVLLARAVTRGAPWHMMNKLSLFRPDAIRETGFGPGRHVADPVGKVVYPPRDELMLLHYKYLGRAYLHARHAFLRGGLRLVDRARRFGHQYFLSPEEQDASFDAFAARAVDIAAPGFRPSPDPERPPWWRAA